MTLGLPWDVVLVTNSQTIPNRTVGSGFRTLYGPWTCSWCHVFGQQVAVFEDCIHCGAPRSKGELKTIGELLENRETDGRYFCP